MANLRVADAEGEVAPDVTGVLEAVIAQSMTWARARIRTCPDFQRDVFVSLVMADKFSVPRVMEVENGHAVLAAAVAR